MSEGVSNSFLEHVRSSGYALAHHDKANHPIYLVVPQLLVCTLDDIRLLDGFTIGGSYANGRYQNGDDIDMDIIFDVYPDPIRTEQILKEVEQRFSEKGLIAEIRDYPSTAKTPALRRITRYESHPQTPFVVRNEKVASAWGLSRIS